MLSGFESHLPHLQHPPHRPPRTGFKPSKYERKLGRMCQAIVNQKRRVNIPQKPFFEAGFELGDRVQVTCDGYGRVVLERIELPGWTRSDKQASNG